MQEKLSTRTKRVLACLALSVFLAGGAISLASLEMNPFEWPHECRPLSILVAFLFFQWIYRDTDQEEKDRDSKWIREYKVHKDKDYYKQLK